jgi:hypothetical protein
MHGAASEITKILSVYTRIRPWVIRVGRVREITRI